MKHPQYYLRDAVAAAGENSGMRFRNDYSGRGMYGKTCVGISGHTQALQSVLSEAIIQAGIDSQNVQLGSSREETNQFYRQLVRTLNNFRTDNMGMKIIMYWPDLEPISKDLL